MLSSAELSAQVSINRVFCGDNLCPRRLELVNGTPPTTIELRGDRLGRLESGAVSKAIGSRFTQAINVQLGDISHNGHRRSVTLTAQRVSTATAYLTLQFRTRDGENLPAPLQVMAAPMRLDLALTEIRVTVPQHTSPYSQDHVYQFDVFVTNRGNVESGNINSLCSMTNVPNPFAPGAWFPNAILNTSHNSLPLAAGETRMVSHYVSNFWFQAGTYQYHCYWWPACCAPTEYVIPANDRMDRQLVVPLLPAVLKQIRMYNPNSGEESYHGGERVDLGVELETQTNGGDNVDIQFSSSRPDIVPAPPIVTIFASHWSGPGGKAVYLDSAEVTEVTPVTFTATLGSVTKTLTIQLLP